MVKNNDNNLGYLSCFGYIDSGYEAEGLALSPVSGIGHTAVVCDAEDDKLATSFAVLNCYLKTGYRAWALATPPALRLVTPFV